VYNSQQGVVIRMVVVMMIMAIVMFTMTALHDIFL